MTKDLKNFVKFMRAVMVQMLVVQRKKLETLKTKTTNTDKAEGIQEAIDSIQNSINTGNAITDIEIEKKIEEIDDIYEQIKVSKKPFGDLN